MVDFKGLTWITLSGELFSFKGLDKLVELGSQIASSGLWFLGWMDVYVRHKQEADFWVRWYFTKSIIGKISLKWSIDIKEKLCNSQSVRRDGIQS